jgi:hypothetical protein
MGRYEALRSGDPIAATAWIDEDTPAIEGDDVTVHAELTDVDEVTVIVLSVGASEGRLSDVSVHLSRVQAIALAGQLASAATRSPADLPPGHGPDGLA